MIIRVIPSPLHHDSRRLRHGRTRRAWYDGPNHRLSRNDSTQSPDSTPYVRIAGAYPRKERTDAPLAPPARSLRGRALGRRHPQLLPAAFGARQPRGDRIQPPRVSWPRLAQPAQDPRSPVRLEHLGSALAAIPQVPGQSATWRPRYLDHVLSRQRGRRHRPEYQVDARAAHDQRAVELHHWHADRHRAGVAARLLLR